MPCRTHERLAVRHGNAARAVLAPAPQTCRPGSAALVAATAASSLQPEPLANSWSVLGDPLGRGDGWPLQLLQRPERLLLWLLVLSVPPWYESRARRASVRPVLEDPSHVLRGYGVGELRGRHHMSVRCDLLGVQGPPADPAAGGRSVRRRLRCIMHHMLLLPVHGLSGSPRGQQDVGGEWPPPVEQRWYEYGARARHTSARQSHDTQAAPFFARLERDTTVLGMLAEGEEIEVLARVVDEDGRIKVQHPRGWTPAYAPDGRQILYPTDERISGAPLNTSNSNPLYGGSQQFPQQPQLQPQFMERNQLSVLDTSARAGAGATPMPDTLSMGMSRPSSSLGSSETASLQEFLAAHQLSQYVEPMKAIGVTEIEHLADMEEADYIEAGMKKMEIRRLVRVLGEVYISLQRSPATQ